MVSLPVPPAQLPAARTSAPQACTHRLGVHVPAPTSSQSSARLLLRRSWRASSVKADSTPSLSSGNGSKLGTEEPSTTARSAATATASTSDIPDIIGTISTRLPEVLNAAVPEDVLQEFEHKLEADIKTVGVTLTAILGVIIFWRGVWSLLDHYIGDSVVGDICCSVLGLCIILYIRLSGAKLASFWPPS